MVVSRPKHGAARRDRRRRSSESFDNGDYVEGKRLALTLRILVHDTRSSTSLLQSLGIKDKLRYYDRYVGFTRLDLGAAEVNAYP